MPNWGRRRITHDQRGEGCFEGINKGENFIENGFECGKITTGSKMAE